MIDFILQEPLVILLAFILIVATCGLISSERSFRRNGRELTRIMSLIEFSPEECCKCERREDCRIYIESTGLTNKDHQ